MNHILDDMIRREAQLQRVATFMVNQYINPTAQQLSRDLPSLLIGYSDLNVTERAQLFSQIRQMTLDQWGGIWSSVDGDWSDIMSQEANFQYDLYDDFAPETLVQLDSVDFPLPKMIVGSESSVTAGVWAQFVAANITDTVKQVDGTVQRGIRDGLTTDEITRQLRGTYNRRTKQYSGGIITGKQARRAEALARTGISHHTNAVRDRFAEENDDVITDRIFFATLDSRTTTICLSNHLRKWKIDDKEYPRLPLHYNERSVYIFKTVGLDPLSGNRPAKGGGKEVGTNNFEQVSAKVSAEAWLKRQPRWFVEESLGVERAKLFLNGNLSIKSMVDVSNRPLTLAELKDTAAGARAYRRAGDE